MNLPQIYVFKSRQQARQNHRPGTTLESCTVSIDKNCVSGALLPEECIDPYDRARKESPKAVENG